MRVVFPFISVLLAPASITVGNLSVVSAWTTATAKRTSTVTVTCSVRAIMRPLRSVADDNGAASDNDDETTSESPPSLVLGDGLGTEMAKLRSKYPTSEADYLAAARARNAAKQASTSHGDEKSWAQLAAEKKRSGELQDDAWEASRQEAGNADSQILIPMMDTSDSADSDAGEDPEEPKLLLW